MSKKVIYPQISGLNWPSYVLQAWLRLHELGVPMENVRFLPDYGHYAVPEVIEEATQDDPEASVFQTSLRHPTAPIYDPATGEVRVLHIDPTRLRPRLKVNVRSDFRTQLVPSAKPEADISGTMPEPARGEASRQSDNVVEQEVGRLAHFVPPLLNGLDGGRDALQQNAAGNPLEGLIRQVCARYPELTATLPDALVASLEQVTSLLEAAIAEGNRRERKNG